MTLMDVVPASMMRRLSVSFVHLGSSWWCCVQSEVGGEVVKGVCPVRCSCAHRLCISFQDAQTALQQLKVPLQVSEQDVQVNRTHSKAAPASYFLPLISKRNSLQDTITFACLSSSSASSTRFFLNAATRLVLKSMSSEDGKRTYQTRRLKQTKHGKIRENQTGTRLRHLA